MHSGQGSLEYILLVSGAILVAIIVVAGALRGPETSLGGSEYGLASNYCMATVLDSCFGKTVQSGPNSYACYLNDEGTQCQAQPLGATGCGPNQCDAGENCPADNDNCTQNLIPSVCQKMPGVCITGCKFARLSEGSQLTGCDDSGGECGLPPTQCECNGLGQCVQKAP